MIKKIAQAVWQLLIEYSELKQARLKRTGYSAWY